MAMTQEGAGTIGTSEIEDGAVTEAKLSFDPATQAELDDHATSPVGRDHALDAIADVLSDHDKAAHDALNIDADTLDGIDSLTFAQLPITTADLDNGAVTEAKLAAALAELLDRRMFLGKNTDLSGLLQGSSPAFHPSGGASGSVGPELEAELPFDVTFTEVIVFVSQNNVDNDTLAGIRIKGGVGSLRATIPAGSTGYHRVTGSLAGSDGNAYDFFVSVGAGNVGDTITIDHWLVRWEPR